MQKKKDDYHELLKRYDLTDKEIGLMFGYKTAQSWHNSSRRKLVIHGIVSLEARIINKNKKH